MSKKEILGLIIFIILFISIIAVGINRFDRINNGDLTVARQNDADE